MCVELPVEVTSDLSPSSAGLWSVWTAGHDKSSVLLIQISLVDFYGAFDSKSGALPGRKPEPEPPVTAVARKSSGSRLSPPTCSKASFLLSIQLLLLWLTAASNQQPSTGHVGPELGAGVGGGSRLPCSLSLRFQAPSALRGQFALNI